MAPPLPHPAPRRSTSPGRRPSAWAAPAARRGCAAAGEAGEGRGIWRRFRKVGRIHWDLP